MNFILRGTYQERCFVAVGHYNSKDYTFVSEVQNAICPDAPENTYTDKYLLKKTELVAQQKRTAKNKALGMKRVQRFKMADRHYGDVIEDFDMPREIFEKKKTQFIVSLEFNT